VRVDLLNVHVGTVPDPEGHIVVDINNHAKWELTRARAVELALQLVTAVNDSFDAHTPIGTLQALDAMHEMASDLEGR
jgi:hypothetical protein